MIYCFYYIGKTNRSISTENIQKDHKIQFVSLQTDAFFLSPETCKMKTGFGKKVGVLQQELNRGMVETGRERHPGKKWG